MVGKLTPDNMMSASLLPALMNLSPYKTPNAVLGEFIDRDENKPVEQWAGNELTFWGDVHEGVILKEVQKRLELTELEDDFNQAFFHDALPLAASLDGRATVSGEIVGNHRRGVYLMNTDGAGIMNQKIILECKTTQAPTEDVPALYRGPVQLQAQMMCAGAEWGAVCVLYRGSTLRIFLYKADPVVQARITEAVKDFENRRFNKDWYPLQHSEDGNVAFGQVDDAAPPLDVQEGDVQDAIEVLVEAKRLKKEAEEEIANAEVVIKEFMGNHEEARTIVDGTDTIIKWPMRKRRAQPEKVTPAKPEAVVRQNTLLVKELKK